MLERIKKWGLLIAITDEEQRDCELKKLIDLSQENETEVVYQ